MPPKNIATHLYDQPWLITAAGLDTICLVADREGSIEAVLAKRGEAPANTTQMQVRGKVAVIDVNGPIFRFANLFTDISGATALSSLATDFQAALDNPRIEAVILNFGTPGGQAAGIHEMANQIRAGSQQKTVIGYAHEMAASAGYWLGAACSELVVDKTAMLGSIGVVIGVQAPDGCRTIEFVSDCSPKKRLDPTSEEGRSAIMERANGLASVFVESVAGFRGVTVEKVLADFGQGGELIGDAAVAAGMADRTGSLEGLIAELNNNQYQPRPFTAGLTAASAAHTNKEISQMDKKELLAKYPEACQALIEDGKAAGQEGMTAAVAAAKVEGVNAESTRIMGLLSVHAGDEQAAAFGKVVAAGVSVEQLQAIKALSPAAPAAAADVEFKAEMLAGIKQAGAAQVGADGADLAKGKDFEALVADHMAATKCKKGEAMRAVSAAFPAQHEKWLAAKQKA